MKLTPSQLAENIFDVIGNTSFANQAANDLEEYLEDKETIWDSEKIEITDDATGEIIYTITITKP